MQGDIYSVKHHQFSSWCEATTVSIVSHAVDTGVASCLEKLFQVTQQSACHCWVMCFDRSSKPMIEPRPLEPHLLHPASSLGCGWKIVEISLAMSPTALL